MSKCLILLSSIFLMACIAQYRVQKVPYWYVDVTTSENLLIRGDSIDNIDKTVENLIGVLNRFHSEYHPKILFDKQINDTVYISLEPESKYSEQMGTTGAEHFLMELVFTLTEDKTVNYIYLDVEIGSHGKPGYYNRKKWASIKKIK